MNLPLASLEQKNIINLLKNYNVIVDAVAGSGKTTTILHIAKKYPDTSILSITYNERLKTETKQKAADLELENLHIYNYNSYAVKYLHKSCYTDENLLEHMDSNITDKNKYGIIIIDEAQDMT